MDFSPAQQREKFNAPNVNYTEPMRVRFHNEGAQALAKESSKLGLTFWGGALAYKEQVDSAKSLEANNEYNRLMSEGTAELMQRKQEKALNIVEDYDKLQAKVLEQIQKKYKNYIGYGKAAVEFNNYTTKDNATRRANMLKYQLAETDSFHETQFNNSMATCNQMVLDGGGSNAAIDGAVNRMETLVDSRYENYGDEKKKEQKRILKSQLVSSALGLAVQMQDYVRMSDIVDNYRKFIDPKTYASIKGMVWKREKEATELSDGQRMMQIYGGRPTEAQIREFAEANFYKRYPSESGVKYTGSNAEVWAAAKHVEERTGGKLKAEWIYRQWYHETFYDGEPFNSRLVHENKNFGGLTQVEPNGEDNRQPEEGATNYYREFNSLQEYADAYVDDFIRYYDGIDEVHDLASFARFLKYNGYYGGDDESQFEDEIANYLAGMERAEMDVDDSSPKASPQREPSGVEFEKYVDSLRAFAKKQEGIANAETSGIVQKGKLEIQDLYNHGVMDEDQYRGIIQQKWVESGYNDDVRIKLETDVNRIVKSIQRSQEAETRRQEREQRQQAKGEPSAKFNTSLEEYLIHELSAGNIKSKGEIVDFLTEQGITSDKEQKKGTKLFDDYYDNKGVFSIDYKTVEAYVPEYENVKGKDKLKMSHTIRELSRMEAKKWAAEHDGEMPEDVQLAEMVSKAFTEKVVTGGRTMEGSWLGSFFGEDITISRADLAANGYMSCKYLGDGTYMLMKLDGYNRDYLSEEEVLNMVGDAGNVEQ